ncbi:glycosyltransferase [Mesorhizobium sp.]|uniref:glycosyltransferase n=1 Tax=Mesorhizobium sp. TaxID=1871066 RepID=UPI00121A75AF|nr:glycosyltransferase [Mesorhizobium sp.]TIN26420.1 MAG: glycosyltransferase family 1 protein [Mesorhizobium sp.]
MDRHPIHFLAPQVADWDLTSLLETELDIDYPYWLGGAVAWTVQSYLILRQHRENLTISTEPMLDRINIAHVSSWRQISSCVRCYKVSARADYRRKYDVDFEILQNATNLKNSRQIYLPHWPSPRLKPRSADRSGVENVAYAGELGVRNIAKSLKASDQVKGFRFLTIDRQRWHDLSNVDVLIAIRDFSTKLFVDKPPTKLINAWHAGIPLIGGYDSAFSQIGIPGVDYIRVRSESELEAALQRLRDDPEYYSSIVEAGRVRSKEYTRESIAQEWLRAIDGPITDDWAAWQSPRAWRTAQQVRNRIFDSVLDKSSATKTRLRSLRHQEAPRSA